MCCSSPWCQLIRRVMWTTSIHQVLWWVRRDNTAPTLRVRYNAVRKPKPERASAKPSIKRAPVIGLTLHENQHARLLSFVEACEFTFVYGGRRGGWHKVQHRVRPPPTTAAVPVVLGHVTYCRTNKRRIKYGLNRHKEMTHTIHANTNKAQMLVRIARLAA